MGVRLLPVSLLAGVALAVGTVAVHQWWWGLALAAATAVSVLLATPPGWATRLPLALGYVGVCLLVSVPRGAGDYLLGSTTSGYVVLALALAVMMLAIATLPRPVRTSGGRSGERRTSGRQSGGKATDG